MPPIPFKSTPFESMNVIFSSTLLLALSIFIYKYFWTKLGVLILDSHVTFALNEVVLVLTLLFASNPSVCVNGYVPGDSFEYYF